ncbi:UPF0158 family protein [Cohnella zeiphila]|uniref:Uncharacterized protein n=1 Tax=Cohnella zeiphila TaxID=2761120 RepID=A0A7X0SJZ8_9BACL|nr:UPF0158 family protein [Cohnella zeiphila]MBB6731372.1 hypothetical protein [Cohnella zeiphila]
MAKPVKLEDLIGGMEIQFDEQSNYLNVETGEVVTVSHETLRAAEEDEPFDHLPDWMQEDIKVAIDVLENFENYKSLPTKFEINEYEMIEDFSYQLANERHSSVLLDAIRGRGAFRRFKDKVYDLGIEKDWYAFRDERYRQIAIDWCNDLDLKYVE